MKFHPLMQALVCLTLVFPFAASASDAELRSWLVKKAVPVTGDESLAAFDSLASRAKVIGMGEPNHGLKDHPEFRNRLFKYVVKNHGVRLLMVESGILEGRLVDRYLQGDLTVGRDQVLVEGITHGMGPWAEMRELIEWTREYNAGVEPSKRVHFAGPDLSVNGDAVVEALVPVFASIGETGELRALKALAEKAAAITTLFTQALGMAHANDPRIPAKPDPDWLDALGTISWAQMSGTEKQALEDGLTALQQRISREGKSDQVWNLRLVEVARQMVRNLKTRERMCKITSYATVVQYLMAGEQLTGLPLFTGRTIPDCDVRLDDAEGLRIYFAARGESRERALAENVIWAGETFGKAFVFAHNLHLLKAPTDISIGTTHIGAGGTGEGEFLAKHYGRDYVMIFGTMDRYTDDQGVPVEALHGAPVAPTASCGDCLEKTLLELPDQSQPWIVDFSQAPEAVRTELGRERNHRDQLVFQRFNSAKGFDAMVYLRDVRPGVRLPIGQ